MRRLIAVLFVALFLSSSFVNPARATTECVDWTVDENGEFLCTSWENTDPGGGVPASAPTGLHISTRTSTSIQFAWDQYTGATGYVLSLSTDNATTWKELVLQDANAYLGMNLTQLSPATAMWVRVAALTPDRSPFGDVEFATTKGAKPVTVHVVDSKGVPVQGGQITWAMVDNSAKSSKTYGLTDQGVIVFPSAPAGQVSVTLTNGLTVDGSIVSGTWRTTLGFDKPTLRLPAAPISKHTIKVVLENGMPVNGAQVSIPKPIPVYGFGCVESHNVQVWVDPYFDDLDNLVDGHFETHEYCTKQGQTIVDYQGGAQIDSSVVVNGFSFTSQVGPYEGVTDLNGTVDVYGFFAEAVDATVIYDDTVITQQQVVPLDTATTRVQLEYMPYVAIDTPAVTADPEQLVPITLSINDAQITTTAFHPGSIIKQAASKKGMKITLLAPKGSTSKKCKGQLSGVTDAKGKVTIKVCAAKSGIFTIKGIGAASVGGVRVQIKGTAPMPVRNLVAKSPAVGQALVSWAAPVFDGKSAIKTYTITATAKGKKTVTKTVSASTKKTTLTGLANGTTYQISITASNSKGKSDPITAKVPVA